MTLTIHSEEDGQRQLMITVEVAESRVKSAVKKEVNKLKRSVRIVRLRTLSVRLRRPSPSQVPLFYVMRTKGGRLLNKDGVQVVLLKTPRLSVPQGLNRRGGVHAVLC